MRGTGSDFADHVVRWQKSHGRHDLPWQSTRDPYRVWLSEIMLQQTQVATVLAYYDRFLARFPDVCSLAQASLDEVLGLWSGLGYYSRARNLHRCARQVVDQHDARFPGSAAALQALPGIGRSTAAAIAAFCHCERVAILDGNVKRVLSRVLGFGADLSVTGNERSLWERAEELLPGRGHEESMPHYTQGLMDLGANICTRNRPDCAHCPVRELCVAHRHGEPRNYPVKTRKLKRSSESLWLLWARNSDGAVWLVRRPMHGVWAGLYCLPVFDSLESLLASVPARSPKGTAVLPVLRHALTHKDLFLHPVCAALPHNVAVDGAGDWFSAAQWSALGLPAPVRSLLEQHVGLAPSP